ncbi:MAG TPA: hypothetical protein VN812_10465, partial [Candidatus Acidoferrales bacterium]|nr:hypothetical protein [Candidatus Acidoferrales bacterium]
MSERWSREDESVLRRWQDAHELFVREALCVEKPSTQQRDASAKLSALVRGKRKRAGLLRGSLTDEEVEHSSKRGISIMSGQGTGKDAWTSWALLWFLFCFPRPLIPCTAPGKKQLRDALWKECAKWLRHSRETHTARGSTFNLENYITWQAERIFMCDVEGTPGAEW